MKQVTLISDGACVGNPGPGGWAYILRDGEHSVESAGGTSDTTTNNRMELTATIKGLKALEEPCKVLLISDSQYLLNGISSWRFAWRRNGWMRKPKKGQERPVLNADLWQELDALADKHTIRGQWVKGHSGHPDNERCDELAEAQAAKYTDLPCWTVHVSPLARISSSDREPTNSTGGLG
jgi:ribonuclease HI